jgi:hypothetical protein
MPAKAHRIYDDGICTTPFTCNGIYYNGIYYNGSSDEADRADERTHPMRWLTSPRSGEPPPEIEVPLL